MTVATIAALAPLLGLKRRRLMQRQHLIRLQITTGGAALEKYDVFEKRPEYSPGAGNRCARLVNLDSAARPQTM